MGTMVIPFNWAPNELPILYERAWNKKSELNHLANNRSECKNTTQHHMHYKKNIVKRTSDSIFILFLTNSTSTTTLHTKLIANVTLRKRERIYKNIFFSIYCIADILEYTKLRTTNWSSVCNKTDFTGYKTYRA